MFGLWPALIGLGVVLGGLIALVIRAHVVEPNDGAGDGAEYRMPGEEQVYAVDFRPGSTVKSRVEG